MSGCSDWPILASSVLWTRLVKPPEPQLPPELLLGGLDPLLEVLQLAAPLLQPALQLVELCLASGQALGEGGQPLPQSGPEHVSLYHGCIYLDISWSSSTTWLCMASTSCLT